MKYKIEKNSVQETLVIPLYARKMSTEIFPELYSDETAAGLIEKIDYDFSDAAKKSGSIMQRFGFLEVAARQNDIAWEIRNYLKTHPDAAVVNLVKLLLNVTAAELRHVQSVKTDLCTADSLHDRRFKGGRN